MALGNEAPEFDIDDEVLLMEAGIVLKEASNEKQPAAVSGRTKVKHSTSLKQHKYIDYTRALDATQLYLNEIGFSPLLSPEEEVHFARLSQSGDPAGRKRMIESNLRLVVKIARRYVNRGLSLLDLIEEGNLGLIRAVEVRPGARLSFLYLRHLVDPSDHRTRDHESDTDHPTADSCGQGAERLSACGQRADSEAGSRTFS